MYILCTETLQFYPKRKEIRHRVEYCCREEYCCCCCRFKSNYPLVGPRIIGSIPSLGPFEGILTRIITSFGKNHGKLRTDKSTTANGNQTRHLPTTSFEHRTAPTLVGPWNIVGLDCFIAFALKKRPIYSIFKHIV